MAYVTFYFLTFQLSEQPSQQIAKGGHQPNIKADCIVCAELLDDETACNNNNLCQFDENTGVCVFGFPRPV